MAAPASSFIVENPPPLNSADFPFRVSPFPAQELRDFAALIPAVQRDEPPASEPNPHRYED